MAEADRLSGGAAAQAVDPVQPRRTAALLAHPPPALRHGIKLGTAVAAAIWIADASNLSWGLTIWVTVMLVMQPNAGASITKGLQRTAGSVAAALVSIAIYGLFAQQPPLYLASIAGVIAVATYGMTGPRDSYAWMVFGLTTIIILPKAMIGSDAIETLAFERATLTAFGVQIVFVVDMLLWPVRAEEQLREGLAKRSRQLGAALGQTLSAAPPGPEPEGKGPPPSSPLIAQLGLAAQARDEMGVKPARVQTLTRIALLLETLASRVRLLERGAEMAPSAPAPPLLTALERLGQGVDSALGEASHALATGRTPEPFADELDRSLASFEGERMSRLEDRIRDGAEGRGDTDREQGHTAPLSALTPVLRDVVSVLRRLEEALVGLASEDGGPKAGKESKAAPAPIKVRFQVDPIRLQLALRAGITAGGLMVLMLAMGWDAEEDVLAFIFAPIVAFIFAGMLPTRGAGTMVGIGWAVGVLLGWLVADLASIFLFTHLDRMPLSLVYPFAIAAGAGYLVVRGSPLGVFGALFGMITAILPIFVGDGPPADVDTSYGLVCGILLGLAAGRVAQLVLWPRTAMQTFTGRSAAQVDLCSRALGGGEGSSEGSAEGRDTAGLVSAYANQLTLLGKLHAQAHAEPVEHALDDRRRAELLALTQNLFDACLLAPRSSADDEDPVRPEDEATVAPLRAALLAQNQALLSSMAASARDLRGGAPEPGTGLAEAQAALEAQLSEIRGQREFARAAGAQRTDALLAYVDSRRQLVARQLAIEGWLADWHQAVSAGTSGASG